MKELWEVVRAEELNQGDTFRYGAFTEPHVIESIHKNRVAVHVNETHRIASLASVFRRVPDAEDPRVLRRALENLHVAYGGVACLYGFEDEVETIEQLIDEARKELESEATK